MSPYSERVLSSPVASCTWEQVTAVATEQRVVPDACVDLIWSGERLTIAGPDTRPRLVALTAGARLVGVRLRPGVAGAVFGLPASELRDASPDAGEVLGRDRAEALLESLSAGDDPHALLLAAVGRRGDVALEPLVRAAVAALDRPQARVAAVAAELGVSARQLQRHVVDAVGYGPKTLARVLRFRRLQALGPAPLVERALDAGYADQAHMTAEVTELAGLPPVRFLKDRTPTAA
ncbi:MAG: AraC family transcriptional regulator [Solirubrobacterales bacterium]|nr:AraC family transcriptional regulator [Solirubrobacterales bacterium]